jgi:diguanylate cyclase (GGDEF)-like protein/PAS domain S-box-containing protein
VSAEGVGGAARSALSRSIAAQLAEAVPEPLVVCDSAGLIAFANGPCQETFGYGPDELDGSPLAVLIPELGSDPVPTSGSRRVEACRKDGAGFPVEVNFAPAEWEGDELSVATIHDLSKAVRAEVELRHARDHLLAAQRVAKLGSWEWDVANDKVTWSDQVFRIFGHEPGEFEPSYDAYMERVHPDERAAVDARNRRAVAEQSAFEYVTRCLRPDGSEFRLRTVGEVEARGEDGALLMLGACEDVTAEFEARHASASLAALVESSEDAIVSTTPDGEIISWNPGAERLYGYTAEEAIGQPISILIPPAHRLADEVKVVQLVAGQAVEHFETRRRRKDGSLIDVSLSLSPVHDADGRVLSISRIGRDITERRRFEEQLKRVADHDPLTGLFNRRRFDLELRTRVGHARDHGSSGAVLVLDLDNFKYVNDAYGHPAGDELLRSVGGVLGESMREADLLARLGGDEFAVIVPESSPAKISGVVASLLGALREHTVQLEGHQVRVTASIGIAGFGPATVDDEDLMAAADRAMYAAKEAGRDRAEFAAASATSEGVHSRLGWEHLIREALERDRFVLHRQPIMDLRSGEISQHELLLRMRHEDELVMPGTFLGVAERLGLIHAIDRWVVGEAIRLLAADPELRLEVNLSALSLDDHQLLDMVRKGLAKHRVSPGRLVFEITETAATGNIDVAVEFAQALAELGCHFALDDFGAGFNSFYYLKQMPAQYLKIDGDFVRPPRSRADELVIDSIVTIARGLDKRTIAESVEDAETLEMLREAGVDYAQGFHIGAPEPA